MLKSWLIEMKVNKKFLHWIPVLIWMSIIFYLSHQPADESSQLSSGISAILLNVLSILLPLDLSYFHFLVRKAAHFFAYFILGLFVFHALRKHKNVTASSRLWRVAGLAFTISVIYAISDELHQLFIPGRSCEIRDVIIDSFGALFGIALYFLFIYFMTKKKV